MGSIPETEDLRVAHIAELRQRLDQAEQEIDRLQALMETAERSKIRALR